MADDNNDSAVLPAHRPSRRNDILAAAIRQFAAKGFVDATVADVADEADVVVTAVYYHFSGKEELFAAAIGRVFDDISEVVDAARRDPDEPHLEDTIDAVWNWIDSHPAESTLLYLHLPGAVLQTNTQRVRFEEQHMEQAFSYFMAGAEDKPSPADRAIQTLLARCLVDMLISVHTMRLGDGPLTRHADKSLRSAVRTVAARLVDS